MSLIFDEGMRPSRAVPRRWIIARLVSHLKRMRQLHAVRHTRRVLEGLPDHILRDIGVPRGEIFSRSLQVHEPRRDDEDCSLWFLP